jgi:hypothetical protein
MEVCSWMVILVSALGRTIVSFDWCFCLCTESGCLLGRCRTGGEKMLKMGGAVLEL